MPPPEILEFGRLLLELAIIPLVKILFDLNRTISELKITLHRDFVSWERLNEREEKRTPHHAYRQTNAREKGS